MPETRLSRRRDAASTRAAILASARQAFARLGYDGAGVREIAAGAGVTAMLINRYFGSKEQLYAEVLADIFSGPRILTEALMRDPQGPRLLAQAVVDMTDRGTPQLDGFLIPMRSAGNERAIEIARQQIEVHHQRAVAEGLDGAFALERAGLILAVVSGLQTFRQTMGLSGLKDGDRQALINRLERVFRAVIAPQ